MGFVRCKKDACVYVRKTSSRKNPDICCVYVDDIGIITDDDETGASIVKGITERFPEIKEKQLEQD